MREEIYNRNTSFPCTMPFWIIGILVALFIVFELFSFFYLKKKRRLPKKVTKQVQEHLQRISQLSPQEQIMQYDTLLDHCLKHRGLTGSLGEKMQNFGKNFVNENAIWSAHKLRNKIAHEVGYSLNDREYQQGVRSFQQEIHALIKQ